ncbi:MAG TPA: gamma-glutamylcyclotransferase family protein [Acidobacteriaceae bacterium]|jgi:gamma-glutamylcyclotransferase (GGCT)/AIG2-like uncharacterized protein YtfP
MSDCLFTYGTLQPDHAPEDIASTLAKLRPVDKGFVHGVLYDLGDYPGAVLDPSSKEKIFGIVFRLPEDANVLRKLDEYEEFDPSAPDKSLFIRTLHPVTLAAGRTLQCWVYTYNREPGTARILASGRHRKKRRGTGTATTMST